jgi:hypothetical protein
MERYGDWLFYGPMLLGALGPGLLVVLRFLRFRDEHEQTALLARIREVISEGATAPRRELITRFGIVLYQLSYAPVRRPSHPGCRLWAN